MNRERTQAQLEYEQLKEQRRLIFAVTEQMQTALDKAGISRSELARRLGKTPGFITQTFSGKNLTLTTIADTCTALGFRLVPNLEPLGDAATRQRSSGPVEPQARHLHNKRREGRRESWTASGDRRINPVPTPSAPTVFNSEDQVAV